MKRCLTLLLVLVMAGWLSVDEGFARGQSAGGVDGHDIRRGRRDQQRAEAEQEKQSSRHRIGSRKPPSWNGGRKHNISIAPARIKRFT